MPRGSIYVPCGIVAIIVITIIVTIVITYTGGSSGNSSSSGTTSSIISSLLLVLLASVPTSIFELFICYLLLNITVPHRCFLRAHNENKVRELFCVILLHLMEKFHF